MRSRALRLISGLGGVVAVLAITPSVGFAQQYVPTTQDYLNNIWVFVAGVLVFLAVGFALAFGGDGWFAGTEGFFLNGIDLATIPEGGLSPATTFFFQAVFAATAVTIASGAMAERTKFSAYLIFSAVMCAVISPIVVHWTWGGGLIADIHIGDAVFSDFAGSGIVHMTGGIAAFMGARFLGPRIGKFDEHGTAQAIPGHNIPFAILGVFILWVGWFGFNPGSELLADQFVSTIAVNTMLAAAAGGLLTTITIWIVAGKPDTAMVGNGVLAGLVAITAPCGAVTAGWSVVIGGLAGALVVGSVLFFDRIKIDDPVGAVSVHGVCGLWGLLSVGIFARYDDAFLGRVDAGLIYGGGFDQLAVQALMAVIIVTWVAATTGALFYVLNKTIGLRVSAAEEIEGLDVLEHGLTGYTTDLAHTS
jgi:Amt family ammonium transporter